MITKERSEFLYDFLALETPFLISAENTCLMSPDCKGDFELAPPFSYIKSGGYIGYVGTLREWLDDVAINLASTCDQRDIIRHFAKNKSFYTLDTESRFFLSLFNVYLDELKITDRVEVVSKGTYPGVIHANGRSFALFPLIYNSFMQNSPLD